MTIAITGATGQLGRLVVEQLTNRVAASQIIALARDPNKALELGVASREADYARPDTLQPALAGVDRLVLISSSEVGQRTVQHRNIVEAAKAAGVKHIVYTSLLHADISTLSLAGEHLATEAEIKASGIPHTLLRNGWYTENYTGSVPGALAGGGVIGSAGEGKIASAARIDFAEAIAVVVSTQGHEGKTYELAGDEAWTLTDLAAEISRQTGRDIPYTNLSEGDYAAALKGFGLPESLAHAIAGWDVAASNGALFDVSRQLSALIGRATTPLSKSVAQALI